MRQIALRTLALLAILGVSAFLFLRVMGSASSLSSLPQIETPFLLVPALAAYGATIVLYVALWRSLLSSIDVARPSWLESSAVFACSWLARHAPSGLPYVAGKVVLGERIGHGRAAVIASVVYENLLVVCVFAASSCAVLAWFGVGLPPIAWLAIGCGALAVLAILPSRLGNGLFERLSLRAPRLRSLAACQLGSRATVQSAAIAFAAAVLNGLAFALLVHAFVDISMRELIVAGAAFNVAGAAGVAAVPVPSGIGVREAVLVGLLQTIVPLEVATAAAVLSRATGILLDLGLGVAGAGVLALLARRQGNQGVSYSPSPLPSRPN